MISETTPLLSNIKQECARNMKERGFDVDWESLDAALFQAYQMGLKEGNCGECAS